MNDDWWWFGWANGYFAVQWRFGGCSRRFIGDEHWRLDYADARDRYHHLLPFRHDCFMQIQMNATEIINIIFFSLSLCLAKLRWRRNMKKEPIWLEKESNTQTIDCYVLVRNANLLPLCVCLSVMAMAPHRFRFQSLAECQVRSSSGSSVDLRCSFWDRRCRGSILELEKNS